MDTSDDQGKAPAAAAASSATAASAASAETELALQQAVNSEDVQAAAKAALTAAVEKAHVGGFSFSLLLVLWFNVPLLIDFSFSRVLPELQSAG